MDIFEAGRRGYTHKNLIFWMGMLRSLASPIESSDSVLDFGCGHGIFLQLLYELHPYAAGIGVDLDQLSIDRARAIQRERRPAWPIRYLTAGEFEDSSFAERFHHIFCQEVLWMNADIHLLASNLFRYLKNGGRCYCTMGSHDGNSLWPYRRAKMEKAGIKVYTWSIDQVARAFSDAGFAVGIRRLPIDGFVMYHPEKTVTDSRSLYELLQTTTESKMLFYFGKHRAVHLADRLQG